MHVCFWGFKTSHLGVLNYDSRPVYVMFKGDMQQTLFLV